MFRHCPGQLHLIFVIFVESDLFCFQMFYSSSQCIGFPADLTIVTHVSMVSLSEINCKWFKTLARAIANTHKYQHITPRFNFLHWLPIVQRTHFRICCTVHKVLHLNQSTYLYSVLALIQLNIALNQVNIVTLDVPCTEQYQPPGFLRHWFEALEFTA